MVRLRWPEIQAPFYMTYIWGWAKFVGSSEWALRFAGVPWFIAGAVLFVTSWKERAQRLCAALMVGLSPFVWFYLNEARLYSIQIGLSLAIVASLIRLRSEPAEGPRFRTLAMFCVSASLLSAVNVLGMIWTSAAFLVVLAFFPFSVVLHWCRRYWKLAAVTSLFLCGCAAYYVWTRTLKVAPTDIGRTDWQTLVSIGYEQFGFNGLGPGRLALRRGGASALKPWLPSLAIYALALCLLLFAAARTFAERTRRRQALTVIVALSLPSAFIIAMGFLTPFRVLGRHFTPCIAVVVLVLSVGAMNLVKQARLWPRIGLVAFFLFSMMSCFSERFGSQHAKDDYRGAAEVAKASLAAGQAVWWNADQFGSEFYGVPGSTTAGVSGRAWIISFPQPGFEFSGPLPQCVVSSTKTDVYDRFGVLHEFLAVNGYERVKGLTAFEIFQRKSQQKGRALQSSLTLAKGQILLAFKNEECTRDRLSVGQWQKVRCRFAVCR